MFYSRDGIPADLMPPRCPEPVPLYAAPPAPQPDDAALLRQALDALVEADDKADWIGMSPEGYDETMREVDDWKKRLGVTLAALRARLDGTPQPARVPITIEQLNALPEITGHWPMSLNYRIVKLIRAVERHHGIRSEE